MCRLLHLTAAGLLLALTTSVVLVIGNIAHILDDLTAASHDAFVSLLVPGVLVVELVDALGDIHPDAVATTVCIPGRRSVIFIPRKVDLR